MWAWLVDAFESIIQTIWNFGSWFLSSLFNMLLDFMFYIAMAFLELFPDSEGSATLATGGIPSWLYDTFAAVNVFFDVNSFFAVIGIMIGTELLMLTMHGILWIKRFIPGMGH